MLPPLSPMSTIASMEDPARLKLVHSRWQSFIHPNQRKILDKKVLDATKAHFQQKLHVADSKEFDRVWLEVGAPVWDPSSELTEAKFQALENKFSDIIYNGSGVYHGDIIGGELNDDEKEVQEIIQVLCHGKPFTTSMINRKFVKTIFFDADPKIMELFYRGVERELNFLAENPPKTKEDEIIWRAYLGNLLGFLPYSYPSTGSIIKIPVFENGKCESVPYNIEKIALPLTRFASPMNALGMVPVGDSNAQPIITFMGTTFPGAEGFFTTVLADTYPGHHVGGYIFEKNKALLNRWFTGKENVHVVGISLGGALALHAVKEHSAKIARVDAYVPPGVDDESWDSALTDNCQVNIYLHAGDIVSEIGRWPTKPNVSVLRVIPHQEGVNEGAFVSHARLLSGCRRVTILKLDAEEVNKSHRRTFFTFLQKYVGPWLVFIPVFGAVLAIQLAKTVYTIAKATFSRITGN